MATTRPDEFRPLLATSRLATEGGGAFVRDGGEAGEPAAVDGEAEGPAISWRQSWYNALLTSWLNLLLVFIPLGIVAGELAWPDAAVFFLNFFAIIPLAKLLGTATEELSLRVGETIGGLLNATFGNAVELIVGIIALKDGLLRVVQASLLGSVLSNLLLVLGLCFFAGGIRYKEQYFNQAAAMTSGSLLSISVLSMLIPAAFHAQLVDDPERDHKVLNLSRGTSVILFFIYVSYLTFQLYTHNYLYQDSAPDPQRVGSPPSPRSPTSQPARPIPVHPPAPAPAATGASLLSPTEDRRGLVIRKPTTADLNSTLRRRSTATQPIMPFPTFVTINTETDEEEEPQMNVGSAVLLLAASTVVISVCAEYLVGSIEGLSHEWGLSQGFVGLILLPIVGNAAEHLTAVTVALKNKMELSIGVAVGSSLQISLMVAPLLVIIGWIIGRPLTLEFTIFETAVSFVSVFIVNGLISDGSSNYLEGLMLLGTYLVIAWAFYLS
ncbi:calcium/proton exchanger [Hyaloraphidium curvatum]|nr:calcium/proton exchanger [Hyaloraphidium curvatum]